MSTQYHAGRPGNRHLRRKRQGVWDSHLLEIHIFDLAGRFQDAVGRAVDTPFDYAVQYPEEWLVQRIEIAEAR